jgi:hypothetical protein
MLAYEIIRFDKQYNNREDEDPTYIKKFIHDPVEVLKFLENGILRGSTVMVLMWEGKKFIASCVYEYK